MGKEKVHGVLYFGKQGRAKVVVEDGATPISLAKGASGTALHGDTVQLRVLPPKKRSLIERKKTGNLGKNVMKYLRSLKEEPPTF